MRHIGDILEAVRGRRYSLEEWNSERRVKVENASSDLSLEFTPARILPTVM